MQRWELNPLSNGYEPSRSPFAFAAIKLDPPAGLAPAFYPLPTDRSAISAWMEWNWTCPRVTLPSHRFCRPSGSLAPSGTKSGQVRGTCTHPAGFTGLNAAGYIITWVKWILRPESHRHRLLYEGSAFLALPRRNETGAPARTCTSTLRLRTATCTTLTPRELGTAYGSKVDPPAGVAPASSSLRKMGPCLAWRK